MLSKYSFFNERNQLDFEHNQNLYDAGRKKFLEETAAKEKLLDEVRALEERLRTIAEAIRRHDEAILEAQAAVKEARSGIVKVVENRFQKL